MGKKVTMEQIAAAANVSKGLVSRALADHYGVSEEKRSFIKMKATELGYDFGRIKTRAKKRRRCSLLISSRVLTRESYWQPIIRRLEDELSFAGIETNYFVYDENNFGEGDVQRLHGDGADAYVVMHKNFPFLMEELEKKKKPTVVIDPRFHMSSKFLQLKASNYDSSYEAAKYLIRNGLLRLLYFGSTSFSESYSERYQGAKACVDDMKSCGAMLSSLDIDNSDYAFAAPEKLKAILSAGNTDAILCCNDLFAVSALKTVKEMGLRVPEDISIVGFDNTVESSIVSPELTTVDIPREQMGAEAANYLIRTLESGKAQFTSLVLNCVLVKRRSVKEKVREDENR